MADRKKVLVIDDDPAIGMLAEVALGEEYEVEKAINTKEGLEKIKSLKPDCIILDIMMPGETGVSLLSELKNDPELANTPVIMCSGVAKQVGMKVDEKQLGEYVGLEPKAFIEKPVNPDDLIETVRSVIG